MISTVATALMIARATRDVCGAAADSMVVCVPSGISREVVEEVLAHPQRVSRDEVEHSMRFEKDVRSMVVRVWWLQTIGRLSM